MELGAIIKHDLKKAPRTGEWRYMKPEVDEKKCIGCGTCVKFCPEAVIILERITHSADRVSKKSRSTLQDMRYASIDYEFCKGCGVCANVCPQKAIIMKKE